ncbi:MAG: sulfatase-like hydrolase/transferase [Verrucomicrobiota bacterium]
MTISIMRNLSFFTASLSVAALTVFAETSEELDTRPNIIFIMADDMGWGDFSVYGHPEIDTPNIDKLAEDGKLFTQFYVSSGVCSPSRVAFLTGHFPAKHGVHGHFGGADENEQRSMPNWLDPAVPTLATQLKDAGYATAHFGKWHLCLPSGEGAPEPTEYGFDKAYGYLASGPQLPIQFAGNPYFRAETTEVIIDETLKFLQDNKDKPCYVSAWTLIPHTTLNPTPEQMEPFMKFAPRIEGNPHLGAKVVYYSTINDFDVQIGRLMDGLEEMGIAENTIVILSSDNGPEDVMLAHNGAAHEGIGSSGPFRGRKRSLYEGGVRVPFIVKWPAQIEGGSVDNDTVMSAVDLLPTLAAVAGAKVPEGEFAPDGENMLDALLAKPLERQTPLMWEYHYELPYGHILHKSPMMAIRKGDWKLLKNPDGSRVELYNIPNDPTELNNVAEDHPQLVESLSKELMAWHESAPRPPIPEEAGTNDYPWPGQAN